MWTWPRTSLVLVPIIAFPGCEDTTSEPTLSSFSSAAHQSSLHSALCPCPVSLARSGDSPFHPHQPGAPCPPARLTTSIRGICKPLTLCYLSGDAEVSHMEALIRQQPGTEFGGVARTQPFVNCREAGTRPLTHLMSSGEGNFTLCLERQ